MQEKPGRFNISEEFYYRLMIDALGDPKDTTQDETLIAFYRFVGDVANDRQPTKYVMNIVARGLSEYIVKPTLVNVSLSELKTLEESFGFRSKQHVKHPVSAHNDRMRHNFALYEMLKIRKQSEMEGKRVSVEDAASKVIAHLALCIAPGTLKKYYCEGKWDLKDWILPNGIGD